MTQLQKNIEAPVEWSQPLTNMPSRHANLTETLDAVMHGIAQAARGEGTHIDPDTLPTDDDRRNTDRRRS
jgi:hypothetical protein